MVPGYERLSFYSSSKDLIARQHVEIQSTRLHQHGLHKAQYCLLARSNQAELLPAHWDFF